MGALLHEPIARFALQAIAIIVVSRIVGLGARRIRQPMVIAEIVAGIALGPSLLGWLFPQVKDTIFPADSMGMLGLLAQVGLVLFMFVVGLEFDPKLLRGRGHTSVLISHTSIIVPFLLGTLLALYLFPLTAPRNVEFVPFTLFMGIAMSITAFPVLARILVERGLLRTKIGAVTITCAAVDDVTAWCILAFVVAVVRAGGASKAILTTALAVGYIVLMLLVVRPFLERLAQRSTYREAPSHNIVAMVLVAVLASSLTTDIIGIHALFGAFVMGAVVPKSGGFAQALTDKLENLVVVFLLPLFFAFSGLRTQIQLLDTPGAWGMCALIILVACIGKFGGSFVPARLTGLGWREAGALGILMNTRGLMELVVINIGLDLGVISPKLFTMLVIMALVTTFVTTPILSWVYPQAARDFVKDADVDAEPEPEVEPGAPAPVPAYTVLACVLYPESGPGMATVATALVGDGKKKGRFYALRLIPPEEHHVQLTTDTPPRPRNIPALAKLVDRARDMNLDVRPLAFVSSQPAKDICDVADVKSAGLVILGGHRTIFGKDFLGGTVHHVMRNAPSDVGMLIDRGLERVERVLVPYLGSVHDRAALALGARMAEQSEAEVTVLQVIRPGRDEGSSVLHRVRETFSDAARAQVVVKAVAHSKPAIAAVEESKHGYDLVIIGVGPEWGLEHRPFGIHSEQVIEQCPTSLLVVRQGAPLPEVIVPKKEAKQAYATLPGV